MILKLSVYGCLCELSEFSINGIDADYDNFGDKFDAGGTDEEIENEDEDEGGDEITSSALLAIHYSIFVV